MRLHPNMVAGISLLLTIAAIAFLEDPLIFFGLLCLSLIAEYVCFRLRDPQDESAKLADYTADRLAEGALFSFFWFPWLYLFVLNCFLTLYSFLKKKTYILPLRPAFALYFLLHTLLQWI